MNTNIMLMKSLAIGSSGKSIDLGNILLWVGLKVETLGCIKFPGVIRLGEFYL